MRTCPSLARIAAGSALVAVGLVAAPVAAQDASPAAGTGAAMCTGEPRDLDELVGFFFDPQGTPFATQTMTTVESEAELPTGEPVDAATEEAVNAVLAEMIACFDAGQYARAFTLVTDDAARMMGPDMSNPDEDSPEEVRALLEAQLVGTPVADEPGTDAGMQTEVGPGRDLRTLEDGRVGGVWEIEGDTAFVAFEQQDGRWLVDEFIGVVDDAGASGTPAP